MATTPVFLPCRVAVDFDVIERSVSAAALLMLLPAMTLVAGTVVLLSRRAPRQWLVGLIERVDGDR